MRKLLRRAGEFHGALPLQLHSDHRSSTFIFNHQLLSDYFICIVCIFSFCSHASLEIISEEEALKQNFTNLHFTKLHFYIKVSFLIDSFHALIPLEDD